MEKETAFMRSPDGDVREVEATPEVLTPLMAAGWHQAVAPKPAAVEAHQEEAN